MAAAARTAGHLSGHLAGHQAQADRIWLTGIGLVTALGRDVAATWPRLVAGDRGLSALALFDAAGQRGATVGSVAPHGDLVCPVSSDARPATTWSRTTSFAWKAAREAIAHAGLGDGPRWRAEGRRVGLVIGGTTGGMFETEALLAELHADPNRTDSLLEMISQPLTATADCLAEALGPFSRIRTVCSACSSGANAFVVGASWLLAGAVDAVVVGGTDGLCRLTLTGFNALAATDPEPCRPFDVRRKGLNLGEGAGFAVLERASSARARGAGPVAELAGWAMGAEAHHITHPEPSGVAAANVVTRCLLRAGLSPREVDYVNAHGTGTPLNDTMEAAALRRALGDETLRIPVSSSKGQVGHMLGAAGAVEAIFAALAVREQAIPPTMGLEEPDDACRLVHVRDAGRSARVRAALSSSFGFGGMDTVLAVTEPELGPPLLGAARRVVVTGVAALTALGLDDGETAARLVEDADGAGGRCTTSAPAGAITVDLASPLDASRARRLDRPARLGVIVAERALLEAEAHGAPLDRGAVGLTLGTAFGSLDASAAFMHRVFEKGPRFASPAEFPNLVPSSPAGHVSIYHGLRGPTLMVADLGTSGECAVMQAVELVESGEADAVVAGAVEEASGLVQRIRACLVAAVPLEGAGEHRAPRSEGAATLVIEAEEHASARGARPLARIAAAVSWTSAGPWPISPPHDPARAHVVCAHDTADIRTLLATTGWATVSRTSVTPGAGEHEGLGAVALVAATGLVHKGLAEEVLVIGTTSGRGYAITLESLELSDPGTGISLPRSLR